MIEVSHPVAPVQSQEVNPITGQDEHETLETLFQNVDLSLAETHAHECFHTTGPGRPPRSPLGLFRAFIVMRMKGIRSIRELSRILDVDPRLRRLCLIEDDERGYPRSVLSRFTRRVGAERLRRIIDEKVIMLLRRNDVREVDVVLDASFIKAWSIRHPRDNRRGFSDPDARVGRHGRGKKGFLLGYLSLFLVDIEGFPLGHVEAPLNVNEKQLVEALLTRVLGECMEVELLAADSQFESQGVFELLESLKIGHIIAWRRLKSRENPPDVLSVKDRIDVEGPEWKRVVYKRLRAVVEGFNGRVKSRAAYSRLTWQGLGNASIHVSLVLMVVYAVCIAAYGLGRPELRQSIAFFA